MEFALWQCNLSIRQLAGISAHVSSGYNSIEATCCVLTASILFIYLAIVRLHIREAFQHIRSAVKVLRDFEKSHPTHSSRSSPSPGTSQSPVFPVPVAQLRTVLFSLYGQLRIISNDVFVDDMRGGDDDLLVSAVKPATIFLSLPEAHIYIERLLHNTQAFLQQTHLHPPDPADEEGLASVVHRHKELCQALDSSWGAIEMLTSSLNDSTDASVTDQQAVHDGLLVLRLNHLLISARLRIDIFRLEDREAAFDELEGHLEEMLSLCEILVDNEKRQPERAVCSSGLGYVLPLHTVAARCRNPNVRRRALELLVTGSRRDGLWDSRLTGLIASQTLAIEESASDVPDADKRVMEVKINLVGDKAAKLQFVTVGDWKNRLKGQERVISW
jgi:hypothetical protein